MAYTSPTVKYRYNKKAYDVIYVRVPKGRKELIKQSAETAGESLNEYVCKAINTRMICEN